MRNTPLENYRALADCIFGFPDLKSVGEDPLYTPGGTLDDELKIR